MDAAPCTVSTSADGVPAVPNAGCFAEVEAPAGNGKAAAETGCVTPEPSTFSGVIEVTPWTLITSADGVPAVPRAGCFAEVEAPAGSGNEAADTGCVTALPSTFTAPAALIEALFVPAESNNSTAVAAAKLTVGEFPMLTVPETG